MIDTEASLKDLETDELLFEEYAIDDTLNPLDRLERYHTSEFALQRMLLAQDLVETSQEAGAKETLNRILPILSHFVADSEPSVRHAVVEQFAPLASFLMGSVERVQHQEVIYTLLLYAFELTNDPNADVTSAAASCIVDLGPLLVHEDVPKDLLCPILNLTEASRGEESRVIASQILNDLASLFGPQTTEETILPVMRKLSEDSSFNVRRGVASHLDKMMQLLGPDKSHDLLFPLFRSLCKDEIWGVRKSCAEALVNISEALDVKHRHTEIFEIYQTLSEDSSRWVRLSAAQCLGPLLHTIQPEHISQSMIAQFTSLMSPEEEDSDKEICGICAHNFPAVLQQIGPTRWCEAENCFRQFLESSIPKVRHATASGLHEIVRVVSPEISQEIMVPAFEQFLRDADELKIAVLRHSDELVKVLSPALRERVLLLICAVPGATENWRVRESVARSLCHLTAFTTPEFCYQYLEELSMRLLEDSVADVRSQGVCAVVQVMAQLHSTQSNYLTETLSNVLEYATKPHYASRMLFVKICFELLRSNAVDLFLENFLHAFVGLGSDTVVNVRLAVARVVCPSLDASVKPNLEIRTLREKLSTDHDVDVVDFIANPPFCMDGKEQRSCWFRRS